MKVVVYSGNIPSSTFIERLIKGLADYGIVIILHGFIDPNYKVSHENIKVIGYKRKLSKLLLVLKYCSLMSIFMPNELIKVWIEYRRKAQSQRKFTFLAKVLPIIWHKPDIFHIQWAKSLDEWMFLQDFGIKIVLSLRGAHINYSPLTDETIANSYRRNFPKVDAFHAVSHAIANEAEKFGITAQKTKVIYSGLDPEQFEFQKAILVKSEKFKIISIGRPHWIKGYNYSVDACSILAENGMDYEYTIVGGNSEELLFQVHQLGLSSQVKILPAIPHENAMELLKKSDLLLLPSLEEGIANVVLEAMALGIPVISTRCGGMEEVIVDNVTGFLADIRNSLQLSETIIKASKLDYHERLEILKRARLIIEEKFNVNQLVENMIGLYESCRS